MGLRMSSGCKRKQKEDNKEPSHQRSKHAIEDCRDLRDELCSHVFGTISTSDETRG